MRRFPNNYQSASGQMNEGPHERMYNPQPQESFILRWLFLILIFGIVLTVLILISIMFPKVSSIETQVKIDENSKTCDDGNQCTVDLFSKEVGCSYSYQPPGSACDNVCSSTGKGICKSGHCGEESCLGACNSDPECPAILTNTEPIVLNADCTNNMCLYTSSISITNSSLVNPNICSSGADNKNVFSKLCLGLVSETFESKKCLVADAQCIYFGSYIEIMCQFVFYCSKALSHPNVVK